MGSSRIIARVITVKKYLVELWGQQRTRVVGICWYLPMCIAVIDPFVEAHLEGKRSVCGCWWRILNIMGRGGILRSFIVWPDMKKVKSCGEVRPKMYFLEKKNFPCFIPWPEPTVTIIIRKCQSLMWILLGSPHHPRTMLKVKAKGCDVCLMILRNIYLGNWPWRWLPMALSMTLGQPGLQDLGVQLQEHISFLFSLCIRWFICFWIHSVFMKTIPSDNRVGADCCGTMGSARSSSCKTQSDSWSFCNSVSCWYAPLIFSRIIFLISDVEILFWYGRGLERNWILAHTVQWHHCS